MAKMDKKWIVLCSAAVAAVYTAGYYTTETAAISPSPVQHNQINTLVNPVSTGINKDNGKASASQAKVESGAQAQHTSIYRDGSYEGSGSNRRGSIKVVVTIHKDKITDVEISQFAMHYSEQDVVDMPDEVISKQSAQVNNVSGATYSTEAFSSAVQDALDQARNS
ncbi:FMN-binding protein [Paenibacillus barcinonensis]|uniref:FMN-binding protein n=1 Tax=Paenibacillus barcinonensis TaxID=198119 RepID=A0A2V4UW20_PAEBA|nr:FMN-binding protein [Paenibacillus barcinonensis]PYE44397.1 FMN-binding protein [Paenibacillus barcinonensis]QKS58055.1 FMN-binding protein [Paenibacillus barcinonensis]